MRMMKRKSYFSFLFSQFLPDIAQYIYLCHLTLTLLLSIYQIDNSTTTNPPSHPPHHHSSLFVIPKSIYRIKKYMGGWGIGENQYFIISVIFNFSLFSTTGENIQKYGADGTYIKRIQIQIIEMKSIFLVCKLFNRIFHFNFPNSYI